MLINNIHTDWKMMSNRFLGGATSVLRQSSIFLLTLIMTIIMPSTVTANELDELRAVIEQMEARHQEVKEEMAALKTQMEALSKTQVKQTDENERIRELEDVIEDIQTGQVALEEENNRVRWTAYALLEYEDFDNTTSEFDAKNIELLVEAQLTDRLSLGGEIEFEGTATTEPGSRTGAVEVEQAWIQYDINRYFNPSVVS